MAIYEVFSRPALVRYLTSVWSKATLVQIVCISLTWIAPLLIVVSSGGFWARSSQFAAQPNVHFKYQLLVVMQNVTGEVVTWSTYENYNRLQAANIRTPTVQATETDLNGDGLNDQLDFQLSMPLPDTMLVQNVQLILIFDYILQTYSYFEMESMVLIAGSSPSAGAGLTVTGNLALLQTSPLNNSGVDTAYNTSVISTTSIYAQSFDLGVILGAYTLRNQTTYLANAYPVWKSGRGAGKPFVIQALVRYPTQLGIWYYTGFWEMIKWGWVQYVALLVIFWFVFRRLKIFIFQHQLVQTIVVYPAGGPGAKGKPL